MYYIGFLKNDPFNVVKFKSIKIPTKKDYPYFKAVSGPYNSWAAVTHALKILQESDKYRDNPVTSLIKKRDIVKAVGLTKKVIQMFGRLRKKNPVPVGKFLTYMKQLERLVVGSKEYVQVLAKAYEEVQAIKGK